MHNGLVWFTTQSGGIGSYSGLATLDPATGAVTSRGGSFYSAFIRTIPGSTNRLLVGEPGLSPFSVYLLDTSGPTVAILDDVPHGVGSNLRDLALTADGQRMVTASGAPYLFPEFAVATMDPTGVRYPGAPHPNGVAYAAANGGIFVGGLSSANQLYVWPDGRPVNAALLSSSGPIADSGVEVAGDGSRAYAVVEGGAGTKRLETFDLAAGIAAVSPNQSVAGVPTVVTVDGRNLGGVTAATIGGVPAGVTVVSATQLRLDLPTTLPVGTHPLVLSSPLGSPSVLFAVVANTGATLTGTVRSGGAGVPGVELTLSG